MTPSLPPEATLRIVPPARFGAADLRPPELAEGAGATLREWRATTSASGDEMLVSACVATPIPGWVEDMRPPIEAKTVGFAAATAERIAGAAVEAKPDPHGGAGRLVVRTAGDASGPPIGGARTFLGFDPSPSTSRVVTCFAVCARTAQSRAPDAHEPLACEASVAGAELDGSVAPPPPGPALRALTWAVHHPTPAAATCGALVLVGAAAAVVWRRRPRSRIGR